MAYQPQPNLAPQQQPPVNPVLSPNTPAGAAGSINDYVDTYKANPQGLMDDYAFDPNLVKLMSLQKIKEYEVAYRDDLASQMQQHNIDQGRYPENMLQQYEGEALALTEDNMRRDMAAQTDPIPFTGAHGGVVSLPAPAFNQMSGGGIVAFANGGDVQPIPALMDKYGNEMVIEFLEGERRLREEGKHVAPEYADAYQQTKDNFYSRFPREFIEELSTARSGPVRQGTTTEEIEESADQQFSPSQQRERTFSEGLEALGFDVEAMNEARRNRPPLDIEALYEEILKDVQEKYDQPMAGGGIVGLANGGALGTPEEDFEVMLDKEGITDTRERAFARAIYAAESSSGTDSDTWEDRGEGRPIGSMQIGATAFEEVADEGWDRLNSEHNMRAGIRYAMQGYEEAEGDPVGGGAYYYGGPKGLRAWERGDAISDADEPSFPDTLQYGREIAETMPSYIQQDEEILTDRSSVADEQGNILKQVGRGVLGLLGDAGRNVKDFIGDRYAKAHEKPLTGADPERDRLMVEGMLGEEVLAEADVPQSYDVMDSTNERYRQAAGMGEEIEETTAETSPYMRDELAELLTTPSQEVIEEDVLPPEEVTEEVVEETPFGWEDLLNVIGSDDVGSLRETPEAVTEEVTEEVVEETPEKNALDMLYESTLTPDGEEVTEEVTEEATGGETFTDAAGNVYSIDALNDPNAPEGVSEGDLEGTSIENRAIDWITENPVEAAGYGLMAIPGLGWGLQLGGRLVTGIAASKAVQRLYPHIARLWTRSRARPPIRGPGGQIIRNRPAGVGVDPTKATFWGGAGLLGLDKILDGDETEGTSTEAGTPDNVFESIMEAMIREKAQGQGLTPEEVVSAAAQRRQLSAPSAPSQSRYERLKSKQDKELERLERANSPLAILGDFAMGGARSRGTNLGATLAGAGAGVEAGAAARESGIMNQLNSMLNLELAEQKEANALTAALMNTGMDQNQQFDAVNTILRRKRGEWRRQIMDREGYDDKDMRDPAVSRYVEQLLILKAQQELASTILPGAGLSAQQGLPPGVTVEKVN